MAPWFLPKIGKYYRNLAKRDGQDNERMEMRKDTSCMKLTMTAFIENEQNKGGDDVIKAVQQVLKAGEEDDELKGLTAMMLEKMPTFLNTSTLRVRASKVIMRILSL